MNTVSVRIITPISISLECEATIITMPGDEGKFGVLPQHAPLIASLKAGVVKISTVNGDIKYFINGGAARVNLNNVDIVTEFAINLNGLQKSVISEKIKTIKASAGDNDSMEKQELIDQEIIKYETLLDYCDLD